MATIADLSEAAGQRVYPVGSNAIGLYPWVQVRRIGRPQVLHAMMIGIDGTKFHDKILLVEDKSWHDVTLFEVHKSQVFPPEPSVHSKQRVAC